MTDTAILAQAQDEYPYHERLTVVHEHGETYATCGDCGAIYVANETDRGDLADFDTIDKGDDSCLENAA